MAPSPQEAGVHELPGVAKPRSGDEVVITGISGLFPSSENTTQFAENLFNQVDMVTMNDLYFQHPEAPKHYGKIGGITKFDAQFFRITYNLAISVDPMNKKLLEQAYMAMYDSGINPLFYKGRKVGVFIGSSFSDTSNLMMYNALRSGGNALAGCAKTMFANRISFWIDGKGPSYALDCASASSMICLEHAFDAMRNGECDAAIVGGSNLCLEPHLGLNLKKYGLLSSDGTTKCFDKNADGYVRSDAISCIFLQKAKDAKRIYAEVCFAHSEFSLREGCEFSPVRPSIDIETYLHKFYSKIDILPKEVEYVEAEASANPEADANELEAIAKVFAADKPIKVGCVKSNMGNSEPASGVCALTKVMLAYHRGKLPGNLHYSEPLDTPAVIDGKIDILHNTVPFNRGYTAINNFTFNGINSHVLLRGHFKPKDSSKYKSQIPRLVTISARQEAGIKKIINILKNQPVDPEVIGMLHNIYKIETSGHTCRGFTILDTNEKNETVSLAESFEYYSGARRPLCLVFSGMGSQWVGMATDLMQIPIFANTIHKCHKALEPKGVDLINVLTGSDKTTFDNIINCFIGISAVQIGLTDILKAIRLVPDYIIGHSQGEMGCAYFDNCFTTEEMILGAYSRGYVSSKAKFIEGSMAAVGLGYKDILPLLPADIDVACHNSNESATVSGPKESVANFVTELTNKGIFAREVPSTNIAFHSRYIAKAGPEFLKKMAEIIKKPVPRSDKWISTSIPQNRWHEPLAKFSTAEYHKNNMLSPVLFEEGAQLIPDNAVIVEVAPHGLLQAILKRSHPEAIHIPLTKRGHPNQVQFFFNALGKIYEQGYNMDMEVLYPTIEYPVATETQMISHYVEWEHSEIWPEHVHNYQEETKAATREVIISIHDDEYQYLTDYIRNGINVFSEAAILQLVWETFGMITEVNYKQLSAIFKDVQFHGEAVIKPEEPLKLTVMINKGNDNFEVSYNGALLTSGNIVSVNKPTLENIVEDVDEENVTNLNSEDVYKCLHSKGLTARGEFQTILQTNFNITEAVVKWDNKWTTYLDSLLQLHVLARNSDCVSKPHIIKKIIINIDEHEKELTKTNNNQDKNLIARLNKHCKVLRCGGIEIRDVTFQDVSIKEQQPDILESLTFVPHKIVGEVDIETAVLINLQLVADNILRQSVSITEIVDETTSDLSDTIRKVAELVPNLNLQYQTVKRLDKNTSTGNLIVLQDLLAHSEEIEKVLHVANEDIFVLVFDKNVAKFTNGHFCVLSSMTVQGKDMKLIRKTIPELEETTYISVYNEDRFSWVSKVQSALQTTKRVVLVSERQPQCGLFGLVKKLQREYRNKISLVIVNDYHAATFDHNKTVYKEQITKKLTFNIFQKGHWGSYYYLPLSSLTNVQNFKLVNSTLGDLQSLRWVETPSILPSNNVVQVCFSGISQRDSQKVVGLVNNNENEFGMDFSGFDSKGDRIMGLIPDGALASTVKADPDLSWPVPQHWTLEEAATVPLPYVHACYCLVVRGQVMKKHSVFVNGGAGALGQAVISLCLSINCEVFTSVSSIDKKRILLKLFPQLKEDNIGCSRNGDFCDMIAIRTKGRKCDFVINCASGASRVAAMKCVAKSGLLIDVSNHDFKQNKPIGMSFGEAEKSYLAFNMSSIFRPEYFKEKKMIQMVIAQGIKSGSVRPLSRIVYPTTEISRAFRLLSGNKHRGRVLIKIKNAEISAKALNVIPKQAYSANGSFVVVCDRSVLGAEVANRLIKRGARKLTLHLKSKAVSGYLHTKIAVWMKLGAQIKISTENLSSDWKCLQLLQNAEKLGKVQGIFIIHELSTQDSWTKEDFLAENSKTLSLVANLDILSRNNCSELRAFTIISRSSENKIDNYMMSAFDNICQERLVVGLPGTSFKIEALDELELTHLTDDRLQPQSYEVVLNALESSLKHKQTSSVTTYNLKKRRSSEFVEKLFKTLGITNNNDLDENRLVNELMINEVAVEELRVLIKSNFKVEFSHEQIRNMTIASLKALNLKDQNNELVSGLGAFYTSVSDDEFMATDVMIPMRTLCTKSTKTDEFDGSSTHLILIPGFDGQHDVFKPVCERLKIPAMTFQIGPDVEVKSIPELALGISENIKKIFTFKSKFYLLGYSFGVNVALEIASLLEKEGHRGIVYCLDSSPDALNIQLEAYIGADSDSKLQNLILRHMTQLITGDKSFDIDELDHIENWAKKVDLCISRLRTLVSYTSEYLQNVLDSAYQKICAAKHYKPNLKLESELVLIKGKAHPNSEPLESDYGLSKYTSNSVKVFEIVSDHASAPKDCRVSNIVNKLLEPQLLDEFSKLNLCETYLV